MADANNLLGDDFKLYYDTADDYSTPTWSEQIDFGNLGRDHAPAQVEIPKRIAFKVYKQGRKDLTFSGDLAYDPSNADHIALLAAIEDGTKVHLALCNGDITTSGNIYWHGWFLLVGPEDLSLDGPATISIEAKPHADADPAELPAKVTVSP